MDSPPFRFHPLQEADYGDWLTRPEAWKWVHTLGHESEPPVHAPEHENYLRRRECVHSPAHREIMLQLGGQDTFGLAGKIYARQPGTVFLFDHYESRDLKNPDKPKPAYCALWLHLRPQRDQLTFNTVARDANGRAFREITSRFRQGELPRLISTAWDQCRALPEDRACWALLKSLVTSLLLELLATAAPQTGSQHHRQIIGFVREYIHQHLADPLTTRTLADFAGYSPFFFHRLFTKEVGQTPRDYLNTLRLDKAREMLRTGYTTEAIAEATGISSPYALSRFFKQHTGLSPRQWRQAHPPA